MERKKVVIIGGGLSGLAAAFDLQTAGCQAVLLEANPYIGGRTSSWNKDGMDVESGLHRMLGFYTELPALIRRAGLSLSDVIIWEDEIEIKVANGPSGAYGASPLFKPVKTISGLFKNNLVSWSDYWRLTKFFVSGLFDYFTRPETLDLISVQDYAKKFNVSDQAIGRVLRPLTAGVFFIPPNEYSAYVLFALLGLASKRLPKIRLGAFKGGMSEVMAEPIARAIEKVGGQVLRSHKATKIIIQSDEALGVEVGQKTFSCDCVIIATGLGPAKRLIAASGVSDRFKDLMALPTMPEVNIQVEFSEPAWPVDRTVFGAGSPLITFAEQSRTTFKSKPGRLSVILSHPDDFINKSQADVFEMFCREAPALGIDTSKITGYRVVAQPDDFYLLSPGTERLRPGTKTAVKKLFLAGDYVKQPFLATMEGAVISGRNAAKAVAEQVLS